MVNDFHLGVYGSIKDDLYFVHVFVQHASTHGCRVTCSPQRLKGVFTLQRAQDTPYPSGKHQSYQCVKSTTLFSDGADGAVEIGAHAESKAVCDCNNRSDGESVT